MIFFACSKAISSRNMFLVSMHSWKPACRSLIVLTSAGAGGRFAP